MTAMTAHRTAAFPGFTADRALGTSRRSYPARRGSATAGSPASAAIVAQESVQTRCPDGTWHDCPIKCPPSGCYYDCTAACPTGGADAGAPRMLEQ